MAARLPIVGGDPDNWGTVLNDFLDVAHNADGTLQTSAVASVVPVTSVAGKTGAVTLTSGDVGLGNVNNTADLDKPISTATQAALNNKLDLDHALFVIWADSATTFPSRISSIPAGYVGRVAFDSGDFPDHPAPSDMQIGDIWRRRGINPGGSTPPTPTPTVAMGAYASYDSPTGDNQIAKFESILGQQVAISSSFRGWGDLFPDSSQIADSNSGHTLLICWDLGDTAATRFTTFTSGSHDAYLLQEANAAKAYGKTFYVRPWAEMNADWSPFQPTVDGAQVAGGTYAEFIAAWQYLVTFMRNNGATNIKWVFNPTTDTYAETTDVANIWPGTAYVDVLGLDGYNWGNSTDRPYLTWRTFLDIYQEQYTRLTTMVPTLPLWVCEYASKEPSKSDGPATDRAPIDPANSKAVWYQDILDELPTTFPAIRALVSFNTIKERDWRIESDPLALSIMSEFAQSAPLTVVN